LRLCRIDYPVVIQWIGCPLDDRQIFTDQRVVA
jgi:hypothetical protein